MNIRFIFLFMTFMLLMVGCHQKTSGGSNRKESVEAKRLLQGIWLDDESDAVIFKVKGDSVYYPDSTSMPVYFRMVDDTLEMGTAQTKYHVIKQTEHIFWFENSNGDVVKLRKSDEPSDADVFLQRKKSHPLISNNVLKRDTVVFLEDQRYHCYVVINPTKHKVTKSELSGDGMEVENTYCDNLIHVSIFKDSNRMYSKNFVKQMFAMRVPDSFLNKAILSDMVFDHADSRGFHFNAILCIPDAASCYMVATIVSLNGNVTMELLEY